MKRRRRWVSCVLLFLTMLAAGTCYAQEAEDDLVKDEIMSIVEDLDLQSVQDIEVPGYAAAKTVGEAVLDVALGKFIPAEKAVQSVINKFIEALSGLGGLMLGIMFPVLISGILSHTLAATGEGADTMAQSFCFILILVPIVSAVIAELEHTRVTIAGMTDRMDRLLPLLLTLLTALGGNASSAFFHPIVVAASGSMVFLAREVILRLVMCNCAVTAVNHLSDRVHLTRMAQLLRSAVCWLLGVSFTVFIGAMSLQGVCSASIDGITIRAAKYAVDNFVPIVGGMFSDTMDTLIGCTLIVKNALGVTCAAVLLGTVLGPMMRTLAVVLVMKLSAALLEPVAQSEVIQAIGDFSKTIVLFLITMLCVCTMYFLLIVQLLLIGNLTAMLR